MIEDVAPANLCLALVSRDGAVLDAYREFFDQCGVRLFHAPTVSELFRTLPETEISGIIADIPVIVRASYKDKMLFEEIEGIFPNVRVNWNKEAGFKVLFSDRHKSGEENLRDFIGKCVGFPPRSLRKDDRKECVLSVQMWQEGTTHEAAVRAFTLDISPGGLFISTCYPPEVGSVFLVEISGFQTLPFKVVVRWIRAWGDGGAIPGFGAKFLDLSEQQADFLAGMML
ncbi:PilZ domain-containing protein [Geomesophilobacter sediminis]|uniref:PilZ domain-containing protein n=1 Tax=Geomesophilobacter sediminis TaxID=2798584 RepID=A0A8J7JCS1_9BACT|nr:PilZ domain-containing protein [Geomesophilobacter sediminis]MBJ6725121.1 PilZ domain-containing protein [Geomesophilobacter sediminis]